MVELVYCANGNGRLAQIAIDAGFLYGAQLPGTVYHPVWMADQDWKRPNRERYMAALAQHKPHLASVLDLERPDQLADVLAWAEEAAQHVEVLMLIPKYSGVIEQLPRVIGGKAVRLGYSVPTKFGGTEVPLWEFGGWPVHLLGGNPQNQMALTHYLDVRSADGNAAQRSAMEWCTAWANGRWSKEKYYGEDAPYVAFARSCRNIINAWRGLA